jgi:hypothetical protein
LYRQRGGDAQPLVTSAHGLLHIPIASGHLVLPLCFSPQRFSCHLDYGADRSNPSPTISKKPNFQIAEPFVRNPNPKIPYNRVCATDLPHSVSSNGCSVGLNASPHERLSVGRIMNIW